MTTLVEQVADQLDTEVADLKGRVEYIAELAALLESGGAPQGDVAAFVINLGLDDRGGEAAAGMHTQLIGTTIGVVLCVRSRGDAKAQRAVPAVDALIKQVIDAIAGWAPTDDYTGVFAVSRGRQLPLVAGLIVYQLEFTIDDQLRVS